MTTTNLLEGLNEEQQAAVTASDGPILVVAGPGSGKTRVLSHRVAYLILEQRVSPERILAVTFTNKAAREMRDRIERLLGGSGTASGLTMGTFHSLGVRFLRQNPGLVSDRLGILPNFLIYDDGDQNELAKKAIVTIGQDPKNVPPRRMLSRISAAKSALITPDEFVQHEIKTYDDEIVARVYKEYERTLRKANAVDFDDLLTLPLQLFDAAPGLLENYQERYMHVLVDEYQDTNRVQYILVSALSGKHRNLFVVGDPDQSIYAWRQADIRNILDFQTDFPDARSVHLELNYRSTRRIVDAADRVIRQNQERINRSLRTENAEGDELIVRELADQSHEAQFVVSEIRRLIAAGNTTAEKVAVMYRTTAQSRVLEEAFRISDVPYRIVGGLRFYERREVKDVLALLKILYNPADEISLQRVVDNFPIGKGLGPKAMDAVRLRATLNGLTLGAQFIALADLDEPVDLTGSGRNAVQRLGELLASLSQRLTTLALSELYDAAVVDSGYIALFDKNSEDELQRKANLDELRADLSRYDEMDPENALPAYLEQVALVADVDSLNENERGQVTLITLHSAKGLEFPVVFIAGVEEGLLPISRAIEVEHHNRSAIEEERRLFYVGITRAEKLLYITYTANRMLYGRYQPAVRSRFLDALPREAVRQQTRATSLGGRSLTDRARTGYGASTPAANFTVTPKEYAIGQRVFHPHFGEGIVAEAIARKGDQEVAVEFVRHGKKRLLASIAQMEVLE